MLFEAVSGNCCVVIQYEQSYLHKEVISVAIQRLEEHLSPTCSFHVTWGWGICVHSGKFCPGEREGGAQLQERL